MSTSSDPVLGQPQSVYNQMMQEHAQKMQQYHPGNNDFYPQQPMPYYNTTVQGCYPYPSSGPTSLDNRQVFPYPPNPYSSTMPPNPYLMPPMTSKPNKMPPVMYGQLPNGQIVQIQQIANDKLPKEEDKEKKEKSTLDSAITTILQPLFGESGAAVGVAFKDNCTSAPAVLAGGATSVLTYFNMNNILWSANLTACYGIVPLAKALHGFSLFFCSAETLKITILYTTITGSFATVGVGAALTVAPYVPPVASRVKRTIAPVTTPIINGVTRGVKNLCRRWFGRGNDEESFKQMSQIKITTQSVELYNDENDYASGNTINDYNHITIDFDPNETE